MADQDVPRYQSEFPHDNPTLFDGMGWILEEPWDVPTTSALAVSEEPVMVREEVEEIPPSGPSNDLERFVSAVIGIAFGHGQMRTAAILQALFEGGEVDIGGLMGPARELLIKEGFAEPTEGMLRFSTHSWHQINAWRACLRGDTPELAACEQTLDEFTSRLVAACLGLSGERVAETRKLLRRSGVAAFGMLAA